MKIEKVLTKNSTFQKFETLKMNKNKRKKLNEFFIEGVRNINEAIKNNWKIISFIYSFEKPLSNWANDILNSIETKINFELTNNLMMDISSKDNTSELLAIISINNMDINKIVLSSNPIIALFDRPSKKANLGTMLRSCDALGVELLIITGHSIDTYDPNVVSSSMGSFFKVPFIRLNENNEIDNFLINLKNNYSNLKIIGTTSHCEKNIYEINMKTPILFLIGNETKGLNKHLINKSDILATIPMVKNSSASSFNVSCAASIMFYEAVRQRNYYN